MSINKQQAPVKQCHIRTPLVLSATLSKLSGHNVYLKLDNLQPSGSFKIRGVGTSVQSAYEKHGSSVHIISSSGGNAGLAAATASRILGLKCTVFCPDSTSDHTVALLRAEDAEVQRKGKAWDEANALAQAAVDNINTGNDGSKAILIHPFSGEDIVRGNSTLIPEIYSQLESEHGFEPGQGPDYISCVVGGGGLVNGILTGLMSQSTSHALPTVLGVQCFGANAFSQSRQAGKLITLDGITSRALSMGALTCSEDTFKKSYAYTGKFHTIDVTDEMAASSSWKLVRDQRLLVELSCGAALAPVYFSKRFEESIWKGQGKKNIVVVVCGGSKDSLEDVYGYEQDEKKRSVDADRIQVDGRDV